MFFFSNQIWLQSKNVQEIVVHVNNVMGDLSIYSFKYSWKNSFYGLYNHYWRISSIDLRIRKSNFLCKNKIFSSFEIKIITRLCTQILLVISAIQASCIRTLSLTHTNTYIERRQLLFFVLNFTKKNDNYHDSNRKKPYPNTTTMKICLLSFFKLTCISFY